MLLSNDNTTYRPIPISAKGCGNVADWASEGEVAKYLQDFKALVTQGRFTLFRTKKFLDSVARHHLDPASDPHEVLMGLAVRDYFNGPEDDRDRIGEKLWEFGPDLDLGDYDLKLYVKLKIDHVNSYAVCFGFHEAEKPITYPYRKP
jgi:hypothetical protein